MIDKEADSMKKWIIGGCIMAAAVCQIAAEIYHWKKKAAVAVSIIGGADGPTSVFLAGKVSHTVHLAEALAGTAVILLLIILFLWYRKKK